MKKYLLIALLLFLPRPTFAAFTHYTTCTVNSGQVPAAYTKPFLSCGAIAQTRFKTVANGGQVTSASGFDIRPYLTDCITGTALTYELVFYDGSSSGGTFQMHILPATSIVDASVIYMCYGNSALTTDGSNATGTWPSMYKGVWHWKDGTTLNLNDSTSNALNGSYVNTSHPTASTGAVDGAFFYSHIDDGITLGTAPLSTTGSLDWWMNIGSSQNDSNTHPIGMQLEVAGGAAFYNIKYLDNSLVVGWYNFSLDGRVVLASGTYTLSGWNHLVYTWDSAAPANKLYINGTQVGSTIAMNGTFDSTGAAKIIGYNITLGFTVWGGDAIDETQLLNSVLTPNEVLTEDRFTRTPSSFWTMSADTTVGGGGGGGADALAGKLLTLGVGR